MITINDLKIIGGFAFVGLEVAFLMTIVVGGFWFLMCSRKPVWLLKLREYLLDKEIPPRE